MKSLVLFLLFSASYSVFAQTPAAPGESQDISTCRRFAGFSRSPLNTPCAADDRVLRALKLEITKSLCIQSMDAICLSRIQNIDFRHDCFRNNNMECLLNPARLQAYENTVGNRIFDRWLHTLDSGRYAIELSPERAPRSVRNMPSSDTQTATSLLSAAIGATPLPGANYVSTAIDIMSTLFLPSSQANGDFTVCASEQGAYINAIPHGSDCIPRYTLQNKPVRDLFRQTTDSQNQALRCEDTCRFYQELLRRTNAINRMHLLSMVPELESYPTCHMENGASFRFRLPMIPRPAAIGASHPPPMRSWNISAHLNGIPAHVKARTDSMDEAEFMTARDYEFNYNQRDPFVEQQTEGRNTKLIPPVYYRRSGTRNTPEVLGLSEPVAKLDGVVQSSYDFHRRYDREGQRAAVFGSALAVGCCQQPSATQQRLCFDKSFGFVNPNRIDSTLERVDGPATQ